MKKNKLTVCFLLAALILCIAPFCVRGVYFMEPDDYLLNYIANGSYGVQFSQYLVYMKLPAGYLLKGLYSLTTHINWYVVVLVLAAAVSFAVFYSLIWQRSGCITGMIILAAVNVSFSYWFLTYTVVAFLCSAAGFTLLCMKLSGQTDGGAGPAGAVMVWIGYCIRDAALPVAAVCFLPFLVHLLHENRINRNQEPGIWKLIRKIAAKNLHLILILILLLAGTWGIEQAAYARDDWTGYKDFTNARGYAVDYPSLDYNLHADAFEEIGLSAVDYMMLSGWKFAEKQVFSTERLQAVGRMEARHIRPVGRISVASAQLEKKGKFVILFPCCVFLLLTITCVSYPWKAGLCVLAMECFFDAVLLFVRMRFVLRVALPVSIVCTVILLLLQENRRVRVLPAVLLTICILAGWSWFLIQFNRSSADRRQPQDAPAHASLREEIKDHPDLLYVMDGSVLSTIYYYNCPVTAVTTTKTFQNIVRSGSWDSFSARYYAQVRGRIKDPDNLLTSLKTEDSMRFVSNDAGLMQSFLEEHTGMECDPQEKSYQDSVFKCYRF